MYCILYINKMEKQIKENTGKMAKRKDMGKNKKRNVEGPWNIGAGFSIVIWETQKDGIHLRISKYRKLLKIIRWGDIIKMGSVGLRLMLLSLGFSPADADYAISIIQHLMENH